MLSVFYYLVDFCRKIYGGGLGDVGKAGFIVSESRFLHRLIILNGDTIKDASVFAHYVQHLLSFSFPIQAFETRHLCCFSLRCYFERVYATK